VDQAGRHARSRPGAHHRLRLRAVDGRCPPHGRPPPGGPGAGDRGLGRGLAGARGPRGHGVRVCQQPVPGTRPRQCAPAPETPRFARGGADDVAGAGRTVLALALMSKYRVLLVDDEPTILKSLGDYFEKLGHEVHRAANGKEGIATFERVRPDVTILDLKLPDMSGLDVLQVMRRKNATV